VSELSAPLYVARCPAKVNLALHVIGRRPDGYHELDTIFQAVDLWDTLELRAAPEGLTVSCDAPGVPTDDSNLVLRAAALLRERHGRAKDGAAFHLEKGIPTQAGLGGGSSDAAGALRLCARHWELELDEGKLQAIARELGADVPFFLRGGAARGRGRGDRLEPWSAGECRSMLLGMPPYGISTKQVFARLDARLTLPGNGVNLPILSAHKLPVGNDFGLAVNDLEPVVFEGWPELRRFRDALLDAGAGTALLSGSGSTVYGIFGSTDRLDRAAERLASQFESWRLLRTASVESAAHVVAARP
jgi:4-diphosphocytidyl-2-C-methyl-D-erythritol kinase